VQIREPARPMEETDKNSIKNIQSKLKNAFVKFKRVSCVTRRTSKINLISKGQKEKKLLTAVGPSTDLHVHRPIKPDTLCQL
jgi:hypothetical protein